VPQIGMIFQTFFNHFNLPINQIQLFADPVKLLLPNLECVVLFDQIFLLSHFA
jgi:hypothetical protein